MITDELLGLRSQVIRNGQSTITDFSELWRIFNSALADNRNRNCIDFAKTFWTICVSYNGEVLDNENVIQLIGFVDSLKTSIVTAKDELYDDKEIIFISFLHGLLHRDQMLNVDNSNSFMDFYNKLYDVIDKVKWLFSLEKEDGRKIFPIRKLIEDVANTFKLDQEHYLQLVFSLELFNCAKLEEDSDAIKTKMLSIAEEYNILLIKLLCNGGRVCFGVNASLNTSANGTIIVETEDKILIRNASSSYFDIGETILEPYTGEKGNEGKEGQAPIAYYYVYDKRSDERLVDLKEILSGCTEYCRLQVINYILNNGNVNVFLGKCFWVKQDTNSFSRPINPFGIQDEEVIISSRGNAKANNKFEKFIVTMNNEYDEYGCCSLKKRGSFDVLTLDFVLAYYKELVGNGNNDLELLGEKAESDADYLQNILIKIYLSAAFSRGDIFKAIEKYYHFINKYYLFEKVNIETKFSTMNKLIMPYAPYIICDGRLEEFCNKLAEYEYVPNGEVKYLKKEKKGRTRTKYTIDDVEVHLDNIVNVFMTQVEEEEIIEGPCLYSHDENKVVLVNSYSHNIEATLKKIKDLSAIGIIKKDSKDVYPEFDSVLQIICNIGFSDFSKNFNRNIYNCVAEATRNIAIYKLLWHFQFWDIKDKRYDLFKALILEKYYTEFVRDYEEFSKAYFDDLRKDDDEGKLIIAKESDGEGATLCELFKKYEKGIRGGLRKAFDGIQIVSNCKYVGNKYFYHGKEISGIVFITDNVLSGKSTKEMLDFYLKDVKKNTDNRTYLWEHSTLVPKIIASNPGIKIELKTILITERGEKKLKADFSGYNFAISSIIKLKDNEYNWTKEVEDMIIDLYEIDPDPSRNEKKQCIFRPCNMPSENILPCVVKDISLLLGLFQRKGEF